MHAETDGMLDATFGGTASRGRAESGCLCEGKIVITHTLGLVITH